MKKRIESIENQWDILYRDYPEVYDKFASFKYSPNFIDFVNKKFNIKGKIVADIGSGSGKSTFQLAKYAEHVIGIEPEDAMRNLAIKNSKKKKIKNVEFKKGWAQRIPLKKNSVDIVMGVTLVGIEDNKKLKRFVDEASRVLKKGGLIITINLSPGWYGGHLAPIILGKKRRHKGFDVEIHLNKNLNSFKFKYDDFYSIQDYKSVKNILETYGFIFGNKVIEYIKKKKITKIKWKLRVHYKKV